MMIVRGGATTTEGLRSRQSCSIAAADGCAYAKWPVTHPLHRMPFADVWRSTVLVRRNSIDLQLTGIHVYRWIEYSLI